MRRNPPLHARPRPPIIPAIMARGTRSEFDEDDADDDQLDGRDDPDPSDQDDPDDDGAETVPCPYCRKPLDEQAEMCPRCGRFISWEDAPSRKPLWIWIALALALIPVLIWTC